MGNVLERRRSERVDSIIEDLEVDQEFARRIQATTGLYIPLVGHDRPLGVISLHDKLGRTPGSQTLTFGWRRPSRPEWRRPWNYPSA